MSVTKEIRRILLSINDKTQKNELRTAFLDFIGAHSAIKQLSIIFDQKWEFQFLVLLLQYIS